MRSEGVIGRLFSGRAVLKAVETAGDEVARRLEERYEPALPAPEEDAPAFPYRPHLDHLTGDLQTVYAGLKSAENERQRKLMLLEELKHRLEEVDGLLRDRYFKVRHTLEALFSKTEKKGRWRPGFVLASIQGETPRNPRRFLEQVEQTEKFLRDPAAELPALELNGVRVDFVELANDLQPRRERLHAVLDEIERVRKEAEAALVDQNEAKEEFDRVFRWVTRAFESLFHLAGLHELAELIRPSVRRGGRRAVDEEAAPAADDQPAGESTSEESASEESEESASEEPASPSVS